MASSLPNFKVILVGEYGVGKSSIFRRFVDNSFTKDTGPQSTVGLDRFAKVFTVDGSSFKIELWDTAGIERFATLSSSYYQSASAAIVCYSLDNRESFNLMSQHVLDSIVHSEYVKVFLCGNKKDTIKIGDVDCITKEDIENFKSQCDTMLRGEYQISCKTGEGFSEMFQDIAKKVRQEAHIKFDPSIIQPKPYESTEKNVCCSK